LVCWVLMVLANLIYFIFDLVSDYADMLVPCTGMLGSSGECNFLSISPAEVAVLSSWGLTLRAYALAMLVAPVILLLVYWTLGLVVLWRLGLSRLGLTVSLALMIQPVSTVPSTVRRK
jgi:hypothetical protein